MLNLLGLNFKKISTFLDFIQTKLNTLTFSHKESFCVA